MDYTFFQEYWWLLISILGALLVFMLFVQGGQSMLLQEMPDEQREKMIYAIAHRWELTFTMLVVFGGAFFASFPLFYSFPNLPYHYPYLCTKQDGEEYGENAESGDYL